MSTHPTPSSSRASPAFVAGFVTPASGVPSSACSTPMERRLTAQVTRQDSKLRQINDELEDRTRLLERARVSVETLQADLARARDGEDESRRLARERLEANALRISELERELATARGDDRTRDDETHALRVRVATLEEQLDERADDVERLEGELRYAPPPQSPTAPTPSKPRSPSTISTSASAPPNLSPRTPSLARRT